MHETLQEAINSIKDGTNPVEPVSFFLCTYYEIFLWDLLGDDDETPYPEELMLPLQERPSGVGDAINWLLSEKYDLNEGDFNPLVLAVRYADAEMVELLIKNGADANYWPDMEDEPKEIKRNYYLEDIDLAYFNESSWPIDDKYVNALIRIVQVLLEKGKTGSYFGLCLSADEENRKISLSQAQYLY